MLSNFKVRIVLFTSPPIKSGEEETAVVVFDAVSSALPAAAAVHTHTLHSCTNTSSAVGEPCNHLGYVHFLIYYQIL